MGDSYPPPGGDLAPHTRPDFVPPEHLHDPRQTWGREYYGDPRYGYPVPWERDEGIQTNSIIGLAVSALTLMCCWNIFAVGGLVCSIIALTKWQQEPESARNLNKWTWISTAGGFALMVVLLAAYVGVMVWLESRGAV